MVQTAPEGTPTGASTAGTGSPGAGATTRRIRPAPTRQDGAPPPATGIQPLDETARTFHEARTSGDAGAVERAGNVTFDKQARQSDGAFSGSGGGVAAAEESLVGLTPEQQVAIALQNARRPEIPALQAGRWYLAAKGAAGKASPSAAAVETPDQISELARRHALRAHPELSAGARQAVEAAARGERSDALPMLRAWNEAATTRHHGPLIDEDNFSTLERVVAEAKESRLALNPGKQADRAPVLKLSRDEQSLVVDVEGLRSLVVLPADFAAGLALPAQDAALLDGLSLSLVVSEEADRLAAEFSIPGRAGFAATYSRVRAASPRRRGPLGRGFDALKDFFVSLRSWAPARALDFLRRLWAMLRSLFLSAPAPGLRVEFDEDALAALRSLEAQNAALPAYAFARSGPYGHYPLTR